MPNTIRLVSCFEIGTGTGTGSYGQMEVQDVSMPQVPPEALVTRCGIVREVVERREEEPRAWGKAGLAG